MSIYLNKKPVNMSSLRYRMYPDILDCKLVYAEYTNGQPLNNIELFDLEELVAFDMYTEWYNLFERKELCTLC